MKFYYTLFTLLVVFLLAVPAESQTLEKVVLFPNAFPYNSMYSGVTKGEDAFVFASASSSFPGEIRKFDIVDDGIEVISIHNTGLGENRGIHWDGEYYWAVYRRATGQPFRIYQLNPNFELLDSINIPPIGTTTLAQGVYAEDDGVWFAYHFPTWEGIRKLSRTTGAEIDSIHNVQGSRPAGITSDGIYYYYSIEGISGDLELIYIYDHTIKDTVGSILIPEADVMRKRLTNVFYADQKLYATAASPGTSFNPRAIYVYDVEGEGTPEGHVSPTAYNFSHTIIGTGKSVNINIHSTGTANLVIDSVYVSDPDNFTFPIDIPLVIGPGQTELIELTYTPQTYGEDFTEIKLFTNDPAGAVKTVMADGYGIFLEPNIALSPSVFDFGDKRVGSTSLLDITINNRGSQSLVITDISNTLSEIFYLDVEPDYNVEIDSTSSHTIRLWFKPNATTVYNDELIISSNASNEPSYEMEISGTGIAVTFAIGDKVWQSIIPDNPETSFQYYKTTASRSIPDISGDDLPDVVVSTENYWLIAYNGGSSGTGDILWKFNTALDNNNTGKVEGPNALKIAPDLDGDGYPDIIAGYGGGNNHVYAISGRTGEVIWAFGSETDWWDGNIMGVDVRRDFNNDGTLDVLAAASGNESTGQGRFSVYALSGQDGSVIWQYYIGKLLYDVVSTDHGGAAGARTPGFSTGEIVGFNNGGSGTWTYPTYRAPWSLAEIRDIPGGSGSDIVFAEIFSAGGNPGNAVTAIRGDNGQLLWETFVSAVSLTDIRVVPDINNDGVDDIILTGTTSFILLSGATGNVIWHAPMHGWSFAVDMVGDLTGDGYTEFAAVDYGGGGAGSQNYFYIFSGSDGQILHEEAIGTGNNTPGEAVAGVPDVTSNGYPEIAVGTRDGRVMLYAGVQLDTDGMITVDVPYLSGWDMVGLPVEVDDPHYLSIFSDAITGTLFGFVDGTYLSATEMEHGSGYWLRFSASGAESITGMMISDLELSLAASWNLITGITCPVDLAAVEDPGTIIVPGTLFGWNGGYSGSDVINPGRGYWLRTNAAGTVTLSCSTPLDPMVASMLEKREKILSSFHRVEVQHNGGVGEQAYYFGGTLPEESIPESYSLPPLPPAGAFDMRFTGDWYLIEEASGDMIIQAVESHYPLSLLFEPAKGTSGATYLVQEYRGKEMVGEHIVEQGTAVELMNPEITHLKVGLHDEGTGDIPDTYDLSQNFPNPFNPSTTIRYQLPEPSDVRLEIYNTLGQRVRILVNEIQEPGYYSVEWNGRNDAGRSVASGVYLYRIQAGSYTNTMKLIFMK